MNIPGGKDPVDILYREKDHADSGHQSVTDSYGDFPLEFLTLNDQRVYLPIVVFPPIQPLAGVKDRLSFCMVQLSIPHPEGVYGLQRANLS
jgi:hypothetical protein